MKLKAELNSEGSLRKHKENFKILYVNGFPIMFLKIKNQCYLKQIK